jgi:hypothetical protein
MKIFRVQTRATTGQIARERCIKPTLQIVRTYDEYGQEVDVDELRAYYCESAEAAKELKASFHHYRGGSWEIVEYDAEVVNPQRDHKTHGGWFSRQVIKIK